MMNFWEIEETIDLGKEQFEDPNYIMKYLDKHPNQEPALKEAYNNGYIGAKVRIDPANNKDYPYEKAYGTCVALAYDNIDNYYKIVLDTGNIVYETMCCWVYKLKEGTGENIIWTSPSGINYYDNDTYSNATT